MKGKTNKPMIFICHASEDNEFVKALIDMFECLGIKGNNMITCTSIEGLDIPFGDDWDKNLRKRLSNKSTYFIVVHSSNLYKSPVSMNELGAAWIKKHKICSFFVNGFDERNMNSVLTSSHQGIKVSDKKSNGYLDTLKDDLESRFQLDKKTKVSEWKNAKKRFLQTVRGLPQDKTQKSENFDIDITVEIHLNEFVSFYESKPCVKIVSWGDILKVVSPVLRVPHTESAMLDSLNDAFPGIIKDDTLSIVDQLHSYGLAESQKVTYDGGCDVAWIFTEKGRNAYDRAKGYHLIPENRVRDERTVRKLMEHFNTDYMDEYLRYNLEYVDDAVLTAHTNWMYIISGSDFRVFDAALENVLLPFYRLWAQVTDGTCYDSTTNPTRYRMKHQSFGIVDKELDKKLDFIKGSWRKLSDLYRDFISYIKKAYPSIDLEETNRKFLKEYKQSLKI